MYLLWVRGNLAKGKMGELNLRTYISTGGVTAPIFLLTFLVVALIALSALASSISALVLLFFFLGADAASTSSRWLPVEEASLVAADLVRFIMILSDSTSESDVFDEEKSLPLKLKGVT